MCLLRQLLPVLLFSSIFCPAGYSQLTLTAPVPNSPELKTGRLSNGLTYYIRKNEKPQHKVELRLVVNAGSVLEKPDQLGLAHFMEHMSFNGSTHFPKNQLVDFLQKSGVKFGADLNAYTGFDETVYILPLPTDDSSLFNKGLTVLEDWAFNNLFDSTEIEKERGVVLEESRLGKGAQERMRNQYFPRLLNQSLYASRLPIGSEKVLKTFRPATLRAFYKNWYRPNLMAVMVVGDIDPANALRLITSHFSKYSNPPGAPARPAITAINTRNKADAMVVTDEENTNTILEIINYIKPAAPKKTWGDYRNEMVRNLLGSLINQRLEELTQQANPPFLFANTGFAGFLRGYDAFTALAVIGKGAVRPAVDALVTTTSQARQYGFSQPALDRVKASLMNETETAYQERDKTESADIITNYVSAFLEHDPLPGITNRYIFTKQVLPGITLKEVNTLAASIPSTRQAFSLLLAPAAMKSQLPDSTQLMADLVAAAAVPVTPYAEKSIAASLMDKTPPAAAITAQNHNDKLGKTDLAFANGVTVTLKPTNFKNDDIEMDAWRVGGYHNFPVRHKMDAENAAVLVQQMGVSDFSPTDLQKFLAGKTVTAMPYVNADENGIQGSSSVKDVETMLQLVHLYLTQPRKDSTLFASWLSKQKSSLEFIMKNPRAAFQDTLYKIIYSNNPWMDPIPKIADLDRINLDSSMAIYRHIFNNAWGLHFTFVGNIDSSKMIPLLQQYLGSLPGKQQDNSATDVGARMVTGHTDIALKKGKATQALITLRFEGNTDFTRSNRLHLAALLEVLNIEIIEKLREEMSGMYGGGMGGSIENRPYPHYVVQATIPCGPENVDTLTAALLTLIRNARDKGVSQANLDKVKETWRKQYRVNLQNNGYWLETLSNTFINNSNPMDILDYEQVIDAITVGELQQAAQTYLTPDNMVKAVLYPESASVQEHVTVGNKAKGF